MEPNVAEISMRPGVTPCAVPEALMVAAASAMECQVTSEVMSCVVESLSVPLAVNCLEAPTRTEGVAGAIPIELRTRTLKFTAVELPPPGEGLVTTIGKEPAVVRSAALRTMVNCVALTEVAVRATPLEVTADVVRKFDPVMVTVC